MGKKLIQKSTKRVKNSLITERDQAQKTARKAPNELQGRTKERTAEHRISKGPRKQEAEDHRWEEEPLQESLRLIGRAKREWESSIDSLPDLICLVDDQGHILRTNRTVERWNLGQVANLRGKRIHEFFHPGCTDPACYLEVFWSLAWDELNYGRSTECEVKDRVLERHLHIQVRPISPRIFRKGEEISGYAVVFVNDVTEHKQTEKEIIALEEQQGQSQKMEVIARLAGRIAHDFKNLLTPIGGFAELAMRALSPNDPIYNDLREIQKGAERAKTLIHHLTAFSRRQPLNPQVVDINTILHNMDETLRHLIGEPIELVTVPAPDLGSVKVNPNQFEQMILNLAINALDAMPSGGKLILETSNVTLTQDYAYQHAGMSPGRYVMVAVSDTGTGMTDEVKARLFEPFFTTKGKIAGTGLGLSTVYGIVKQSSGYILVYSELGHGTTFKIYLPRSEEETDAQPRPEVAGSLPRGNETVLLVEDEPLVRGLASRVLREQGYRVLEAANGVEAKHVVQMHAGEKIHLLLTDVVMPGMNGRDLAGNLESLLPKMKVLYMSGYTDQAIVHHGVLEKGMNYIEKPFTVDALACKVREVLDRS
jgi:two-component system cell cycle sensor histidine kinase/response regulator CckA